MACNVSAVHEPRWARRARSSRPLREGAMQIALKRRSTRSSFLERGRTGWVEAGLDGMTRHRRLPLFKAP
jgi:hypothetical protein